ncbi:hypothetical protein CVO96_06645 [Deinococcus koreensis]|uniref:Uncharacterized protein n=2 Tax=Deinococcus koreensis TaxID=2054903 RepID=A0A2K3UX35_9DEIO|nr:hypothetical protein CVO96_06645 [Deinococcus koreensis]
MFALLTACTREVGFIPTPIAFADHPSILRGTWTGTVTGQTLRLDLTAIYDTSSRYTVSGTGTLNAEALTVTGTVMGGSSYRYLRPQLSPIPDEYTLTLQRPSQADLNLTCTPISGPAATDPWQWSCRVSGTASTFTLSKGTP